jgi:hypothetical protein
VIPIGVAGPDDEDEHEEQEGEDGGGAGRLLSADCARLGRVGPTEETHLLPRPVMGDAYRFGVVVGFNLEQTCEAVALMDLYLEGTSRAVALRIVGPNAALFFADGSKGALAILSGFEVLCRNAVAAESLAGKSIGTMEENSQLLLSITSELPLIEEPYLEKLMLTKTALAMLKEEMFTYQTNFRCNEGKPMKMWFQIGNEI